MNIKPPVPTLVELKAMEETGKRNGILVLGMSRHWISAWGLSREDCQSVPVCPLCLALDLTLKIHVYWVHDTGGQEGRGMLPLADTC